MPRERFILPDAGPVSEQAKLMMKLVNKKKAVDKKPMRISEGGEKSFQQSTVGGKTGSRSGSTSTTWSIVEERGISKPRSVSTANMDAYDAYVEACMKRYKAYEEKLKSTSRSGSSPSRFGGLEQLESIVEERGISKSTISKAFESIQEAYKKYESIIDAPAKWLDQQVESLKQTVAEAKARGDVLTGVAAALGASVASFAKGFYESVSVVLDPLKLRYMFEPETYTSMASRLTSDPLAWSELAGSILGGYFVGKLGGKIIEKTVGKGKPKAYDLAPEQVNVKEVTVARTGRGIRIRGVIEEKGEAVAASAPDEVAYASRQGIRTTKTLIQYIETPQGSALDILTPTKALRIIKSSKGKSMSISGSAKTLRVIDTPEVKGFIGEKYTVTKGLFGTKYTGYKLFDVEVRSPDILSIGRVARDTLRLTEQLSLDVGGGLKQVVEQVTKLVVGEATKTIITTPSFKAPTIPLVTLPRDILNLGKTRQLEQRQSGRSGETTAVVKTRSMEQDSSVGLGRQDILSPVDLDILGRSGSTVSGFSSDLAEISKLKDYVRSHGRGRGTTEETPTGRLQGVSSEGIVENHLDLSADLEEVSNLKTRGTTVGTFSLGNLSSPWEEPLVEEFLKLKFRGLGFRQLIGRVRRGEDSATDNVVEPLPKPRTRVEPLVEPLPRPEPKPEPVPPKPIVFIEVVVPKPVPLVKPKPEPIPRPKPLVEPEPLKIKPKPRQRVEPVPLPDVTPEPPKESLLELEETDTATPTAPLPPPIRGGSRKRYTARGPRVGERRFRRRRATRVISWELVNPVPTPRQFMRIVFSSFNRI